MFILMLHRHIVVSDVVFIYIYNSLAQSCYYIISWADLFWIESWLQKIQLFMQHGWILTNIALCCSCFVHCLCCLVFVLFCSCVVLFVCVVLLVCVHVFLCLCCSVCACVVLSVYACVVLSMPVLFCVCVVLCLCCSVCVYAVLCLPCAWAQLLFQMLFANFLLQYMAIF